MRNSSHHTFYTFSSKCVGLEHHPVWTSLKYIINRDEVSIWGLDLALWRTAERLLSLSRAFYLKTSSSEQNNNCLSLLMPSTRENHSESEKTENRHPALAAPAAPAPAAPAPAPAAPAATVAPAHPAASPAVMLSLRPQR